MTGNTHITDQQVDDAARRMRKIIEAAENSCQAGEDALIRANSAALMYQALRAHHAWSYCEKQYLGTFYQRSTLCAHAEYLTAKALAAADGKDFDREYAGSRRLVVWPQVRLEESDETEAECLIADALEHERNAVRHAGEGQE